MVKALGVVDEVVISDSPTAVKVINEVKPDFYVKGPDYLDLTKDPTGEIYNEQKAVEAHGGRLVFTEAQTWSSSTIINKFFAGWSDTQKEQIEKINEHGGMGAIAKSIEEIKKTRVLVVGEPITDTYRFCAPEGISSKSPTVSARYIREEHYDGGATAILRHLSTFCDAKMAVMYSVFPHIKSNPEKIRYISQDNNQRIFEVTKIDERLWDDAGNAACLSEAAKKCDVVVAADFGHGLFGQDMLNAMEIIRGFVGLNVQSNSSNFGFNTYKRHRRWDYLCLDTREARIALQDRFSTAGDLRHSVFMDKCHATTAMTSGPSGAHLFHDLKEHYSPAFSDVVVDATGAGDAFFAITTCLLATGCKPELVPFIGNVFAGLKTKILGNKSAVTKAQLLKACEGILK